MTTTMHFQRDETIVCLLEVKDQNGAYADPSTSAKITITDLAGTVVVNAVTMSKTAVGKYSYSYTPVAAAVLGWYRVHYVTLDASIKTILDDGFVLE